MQLPNLTEQQRYELKVAIRRELLRESYYEFVRYFWPLLSSEVLVDNWHLEEICGALQAAGMRVARREKKEHDILINQPPGTSKSTLVSIAWQPWLWTIDPRLHKISATYEGTLSRRHAEQSKALILSDEYQELFGDTVQISRSEAGKGFYRNTAGGFRMATSTGANVTGNHAHIIAIDDPSNPKVALSKAKGEAVSEYLNKALSSRVVNQEVSVRVMTMQRLGEDDPAGDWLKKSKEGKLKLLHLCLPATVDQNNVSPKELKARYVDGLLDPVRLSREVLTEQRATLGSAEYAGQYDQAPRAAEGNVIKLAWIKTVMPWELPAGIVWEMWIDGAYTDRTENDPTGIEIWGYHEQSNTAFVRYAVAKHLEMPTLLETVAEMVQDFGLGPRSKIWVEPKASGQTLVQLLNQRRDIMPVAKQIKSHLVSEGKTARANTAAPRFEAGNIVLVKGAWNDDYVEQVTSFPRAAHDEHIDLAGYASEHYFGSRKAPKARRTN